MPDAREVFIGQLAARTVRSENEIQADVYGLLTVGGLNLTADQVAKTETGTGDGTRRRIDVEIGHLTIEVKKDLRPASVVPEAEDQLAGYMAVRSEHSGAPVAGVLTDGTDWLLYHRVGESLQLVSKLSLNPNSPDVDALVNWLEAILATQTQVAPTPNEITRRLGAQSPAHLYDHAELRALYDGAREIPDVALKRELWAKLLRTAFGSSFDDSERLFLDHTLLVLSAEIIAHAALGFDVSATGNLSARSLTLGTEFANAQLFGVVQGDFFDWVLSAPGGELFITALAKRIAQFNWTAVEHDVLKVLYESVIETSERKRLGEYYTPDWLAFRMVEEHLTDPLNMRVLDPSCGSGTFLFHAVRKHLDTAATAGMTVGEAVQSVAQHVMGLDIHPVAVTLARVTYLLAIGSDRLNDPTRGAVSVPVYLGDALQWEQRIDIFAHEDNVTVSTEGSDLASGGEAALFEDDLQFPRSVVRDADNFDRLVLAMADKAEDASSHGSEQVILPTLRAFGIHEDDISTLVATFHTMRSLHARGRDHIWGYYVRNLIRPMWLAESENRVDLLIGNPPWLAYSKMTGPMQRRFTAMSSERGLITGNRGIAGRDLATLFVVRATELYLREGGVLSFVMPHGTLTRQPHARFRSGIWDGPSTELRAAFTIPWDLSRAATGFPIPACVVHAVTSGERAVALGGTVEKWVTTGNASNVPWSAMESRLTVTAGQVSVTEQDQATQWSPYKARFRQGAVLSPRVLLMMDETAQGPLGAGAGRVAVTSHRSAQEDARWRDVDPLTGVVERAFFREVALGETTLPFRQIEPLHAVLPIRPDGSGLLTRAEIEAHSALSAWWAGAENSFETNRTGSADETLLDRINYHEQLAAQLPGATHRVVYTKAGNTLNSSRLLNTGTVVDHKLYWAAASTVDEARYLVAILNSATVLARVQPFQALGEFGPRDFDKNVFRALIQPYDAGNADHAELADLGRLAEDVAAALTLTGSTFQQKRLQVRAALNAQGIGPQIEAAVGRAVPEASV